MIINMMILLMMKYWMRNSAWLTSISFNQCNDDADNDESCKNFCKKLEYLGLDDLHMKPFTLFCHDNNDNDELLQDL